MKKATGITKLAENISEKEKDHRSQILHIETITMMAKYQLIYIKMENFWKKLERVFKLRKLSDIEDGFYAIKTKAIRKKENTKYVAYIYSNAVNKLSGLAELKQDSYKSYAFQNLKSILLI